MICRKNKGRKGREGEAVELGVTDLAKVATPQYPKVTDWLQKPRLDNLELTVGQNGASLRRAWGLD